jgi:predicted ATPase
LIAWLVAAAERPPVLAVWEALHWADPSTLKLLGLVLDQTPTAPLCTLLTCRPEFAPP